MCLSLQSELTAAGGGRAGEESSDTASLKLCCPLHAFVSVSSAPLCFTHRRTWKQQSYLFIMCLSVMERTACLGHSPDSYLNSPILRSLCATVSCSATTEVTPPGQSSLLLHDGCPPNQPLCSHLQNGPPGTKPSTEQRSWEPRPFRGLGKCRGQAGRERSAVSNTALL